MDGQGGKVKIAADKQMGCQDKTLFFGSASREFDRNPSTCRSDNQRQCGKKKKQDAGPQGATLGGHRTDLSATFWPFCLVDALVRRFDRPFLPMRTLIVFLASRPPVTKLSPRLVESLRAKKEMLCGGAASFLCVCVCVRCRPPRRHSS